MKTKLLSLIITIFVANFVTAQSISFTGATLTTAAAGSTITVNYQYTIANAGNIYCAINLLNDWTWVSEVAGAQLSPAPAGTNVTGSFQLTIPAGTAPTASLTGVRNYKISIELKNSNFVYQAGDFPPTQINITPNLSTIDFENNSISIYPNPTNDFIYFKGIDNTLISQIQIADISGKTVFSSSQLDKDKIDVSRLKSGVYMLSLSSENSKKTVKFVKK